MSYEEAQELADQGYRLGWVIPKGYVVVDIDNHDDPNSQTCVEKLLQKFEVSYNYNYTSRGIHILFANESQDLKTDAGYKTSINIEVDTRANETGYIVLPVNDPHRSWGKWGDVVEEIPYFLKPLCKDVSASFIGMQDGDGRNTALFRWRGVISKTKMLSDEEIEKSIRIINENLFATPMQNQELYKTVLRELETEKTNSVEEKTNQYSQIAEDMAKKFDIMCFGGNFYRFNGTYYRPMDKYDIEKLIFDNVSKNIGKHGREEITDFLKLCTRVDDTQFDKDWYKIACKNGIINLVTGDIEAPNKTDYNTIFIPFEYSKEPEYSKRIDDFMISVTDGDPIKMQFLYQIAGYCLLKKNLFEKFVIFQGEGGTGKSTYTNLLHRLVGGDTNCSHISIGDFDKDYYLATTVSKLLNIDDDVADMKVLENTGRFKSIISGNIISVRQIYKEVLSFVPYITCIFSCNRLPKIMDKTSGLYRRMILVELNHRVQNPDPLFMSKVTDLDMEYFLFKAVDGIKLAIEEGGFVITQSERALLEKFRRRQSALNEWVYENNMCLGDIVDKSSIALFKIFMGWCDVNGYKNTMTSFTFREEICALFGVDTTTKIVENVSVQIFTKKGDWNPAFRPI